MTLQSKDGSLARYRFTESPLYAKAAEATAFVQQKAEPEIFDKAYTGMGGESGGVVGMLEVIESDFARLESDTKASEATSQKEYDECTSFSAWR